MALRPTPPSERCLTPDERTAFALGEADAAARAAVSRHVLRCAACRAALDAEERVVGRLRAFAASPAWASDLAAADLAHDARTRRRRRAAVGGVAAAAALLLALATAPSVLERVRDRGDGAGPVATAATRPVVGVTRHERDGALAADDEAPLPASEVSALVAAQARDGRWRATTGGDPHHDVGATGLALLALLRGHAALPEGLAARAIADGVRWLAPRADDPRVAGERERAVAAAALAAVHRATGDRGVGAAAERARRSTAPAAAQGVPDAARALAYVRTARPLTLAASVR